jgi:hypothetical protein
MTIRLILAISAGIVAGLLLVAVTRVAPTPTPSSRNVAATFGAPGDLTELVVSANLILVATVSSAGSPALFDGYDENGDIIVPPPTPTPTGNYNNATPSPRPIRSLSYTDFGLSVEETLYDDEVATGLTLRWVGHQSDYAAEDPAPKVGDRYLLFLSANPDLDTVAPHFGPYGRILFGSNGITYADVDRTPVPFAEGMSEEQFVEEVADLIEELD